MIKLAYKIRKMKQVSIIKSILQMLISCWMVAFLFGIPFESNNDPNFGYKSRKDFHWNGYRFTISCYDKRVIYGIVNLDNRHIIPDYVIFFKLWQR